MPTPPTSWLAVAHLLRPQGRRGEILAEPLTDLPSILAPGREVALVPAGHTSPAPIHPTLHIEAAWSPTGKNAGRLVLKLSGCDTISQAEALAGPAPGRDLLVRAADLPPLDPDTFFVADLLGCDLYNGDTRVGVIVGLQFPTSPDGRTRLEDAAPLLAIQPLPPSAPTPQPEPTLTNQLHQLAPDALDALGPMLVPFVRAWLDSVDLSARRVVMHLPPGLLDEV